MSTTPTAPTSPTAPSDPDTRGFLAPRPGSQPGDHCYRCGKPTPPGVSVCEADNPGRVRGPSPTQLHATILGGIVLGAIGFLLLMQFAVGQGGPYTATFVDRSISPDGAPAIAIMVSNAGSRSGVANCRVTRDGAPRPDDPSYRTERIEPGATVPLQRVLPAPPVTSPAYDLERMTVICT
jgi:hypothetical protein